MTCKHETFAANVEVNRLTRSDDGYRTPNEAEIVGYSADVHIHCADCREEFVFLGPPVGVNPAGPTTSIEGTELRAPIQPKSECF